MNSKPGLLTSVVLFLLGAPSLGHAQWLTQSIPLVPGWNAVHLDVQPEPRACADVFRHRPVQSVWKWDRRFSTIQFDIDPVTLLPEAPDWLVWMPPSDPRAFLSRLFELQGGQSYLIQVASNAAPFTLQLKGQVILPRLGWYPHGLNLVGLPVHAKNPPTFSEFFRFTAEVDTTRLYANKLFRLDSQGRGQRIVQPARERVQPGVAYWIGCARGPAHQSSLHVSPEGASGLDFGARLVRRDLGVKNTLSTGPVTVWLRHQPSESPPPGGGFPGLAGPVPLSYLSKNASNEWVWGNFPIGGLTRTLAAGEEWSLRLGVRRDDFAPHAQHSADATYQSFLEVTDAAGSLLIRVPVRARQDAQIAGGGLEPHDDNEGLWVGQAVVNQVNAPAFPGTNLLSTPSPMSFRLLMHVDAYGQARLLQQVVLAWDPSLKNAPHTQGAYALHADERTLTLDASDVNRISSTAFPLMAPVVMVRGLTNELNDVDGGTNAPTVQVMTNVLSGRVVVNFDDPTNPFLHRYHPLHDNRDADFTPYTEAVETRTIVRDLALTFDAPIKGSANPYDQANHRRGVYQETLLGLRAQPIVMQGVFALQRISRINELQGITP